MTQEHRESLSFLLQAIQAIAQGFKLSASLLTKIGHRVSERLKADTDK